jgi:hypothetical protein
MINMLKILKMILNVEKHTFIRSNPMKTRTSIWLSGLTLILTLFASAAALAQETTGSVRGSILAPDGAPVAGALVEVKDTRTGTKRTSSSNDKGAFNIRGLSVGGPYEIRVSSSAYKSALIEGVFTTLGESSTFNIPLETGDLEEVVVTASARVSGMNIAVGPGTAFSYEDIQTMPSIARQIRDVARLDPRVSLGRADNGSGSGINCLGGSSRSNAFTIDGTLAADGFGLNEGTGTAARSSFPIPYDTVQSASVEFAPLDVQYSQFTGCAINVVTKPGSNEFHGSTFYLFNDDSMTGDSIRGREVISDPFEDTNWGVNLSGPIIKDRLFFTVNYEETDEGGIQSSGPIGGGFANEDWLTVGEADEIAGVLLNQYGRDVGPIVRLLPQFSERWFGRLDWNINDNHRAEMTYTKLEELNLDPDDLGFGGFTFEDNFEFEGIDHETVSVRLFSNWTDTFSTEVRYSTIDVIDTQGPVGGGEAQDANPITRIEVEDGGGGTILTSGPGFFRSSNDLQYSIDQYKVSADWVVDDHTITFGTELESRDIFNLFIPNATGTIVFADTDALRAGTADSFNLNGSFTGNPSDAAAAFKRDINSYYVQDEWSFNDRLTFILGVRYDEYSTDVDPIYNPVFEQRYGFSNEQTFEGLDLIQPRIGLTYDLPPSALGEAQVRVGYGVFGGGDPTVHFANAYQNFGGAIGFAGDFSDPCTAADLQVTDANGQFTGLPDCVGIAAAASANANTGPVAAVAPDFKLPSNHRYNIGLSLTTESEWDFWNGWEVQFDYIYTKLKDRPFWVDLRLTPNGVTMPDGRPQFFEVDPLRDGCNATFNGPGQGFSNAGTNGGPCDDVRNSNQDILMTNGIDGSSDSIAIQFSKLFHLGDRTTLNFGLGYSYLKSKYASPINSSTAGSSYEEVAVRELNQPLNGPGLWANKHNYVLRAQFEHEWADGYPFSIAVFLQTRSGRPFSYTYEDDTVEDYFGDSDDEERILLYVPTGPNDPLFDFSNLSAASTAELFAFLDSSGLSKYAGGIAPKNGFEGPWNTDMDIRIQQDIKLPWGWGGESHKLTFFFDVENLLNLFSDSSNVFDYTDTGDIEEGVRVLEIGRNGQGNTDQFVINRWYDEGINQDVDDSVWRMQLGLRYTF